MGVNGGRLLYGTHGNSGIARMRRPAETRYNLGSGPGSDFSEA